MSLKTEHCQLCGRKMGGKPYLLKKGNAIIPVCSFCYEENRSIAETIEQEVEHLYPELNTRHSPLSTLILRGIGFREAILPLGISVRKGETEEKGAEAVRFEEIDWDVLVGSEPIDELKGKGIAHVLAAKFAEESGVVTTKELARYLAEMAQNPELEPFLERFKNINEDAAREILNDLAELNVVKKEARKGARGANIYDYLSAERSWRKEGY